MGLDMYLSARCTFYKMYADTNPAAEKMRQAVRAAVDKNDFTSGNIETTQVEIEAAYWRKANSIHAWFVRNVQDGNDDCGEYTVSREDLINLRNTCKRVLADTSLANELLPPQPGFFFGSTDIDEWYWEDLKATVAKIDAVLLSFKESEGWTFVYQSSW